MLNEDRVKEITILIKQRMNGVVVDSMQESGIIYKVNYGVTIPELQQIAQPYKGDHDLAIQLFEQDIRECKLIASMIDDPSKVTGAQIDDWCEDFNNHEIVEQVCNNLLWKSDFALPRSYEWCLEEDELLKKAGLLIVGHRASDNTVKDSVFEPYIGIVENLAETEDELVSNAAIYALRQIAKRSESLNSKVSQAAERMTESDFGIANWIGNQLLFELTEE
ncbi:MAG: DNA alkylation repair protein [Bacteroidales bacterium]|nr:MAG: DNA alkylation repair protein [Bacteroidales bacterium]